MILARHYLSVAGCLLATILLLLLARAFHPATFSYGVLVSLMLVSTIVISAALIHGSLSR